MVDFPIMNSNHFLIGLLSELLLRAANSANKLLLTLLRQLGQLG